MQRRNQAVPEDLKKQRLKYRVQVKLLGAVRDVGGTIRYVPSQRRLPHLGAKVALPSADVLRSLCKLSGGTTELGNYVLGEFVYAGASATMSDDVLRPMDPSLPVMFDIHNLVSRRSVVFARAGYGKSNLIKFLIAELYRTAPKTEAGQPVGTLIFDADGEYFWPDTVRKRPGLCDVPHVQDKIAVFTNRNPPSPYYGTWKLGSVKLDIRDLPARDVIGIAVASHRQNDQNVLKLKGCSQSNWRQLVDLIDSQGLQASDQAIGQLLGYNAQQIQQSAAEIAAARSNMSGVVRMLHDPNSRVLSGTIAALQQGSIVVIDISLLSSSAGNMLAGLILRRIFSHNQENFTGGQPIIPAIMVLEEAQSVLGRNLDDTSPFVEWVKEGRKYDLGGILITQQPGSMASELLSQADNWFCFHLLSEGDASVLGKFNSHFSDDVLSHLIGEPIRGNCYMWSAPHQPFVLPVRIRSFEQQYAQYVKADPATTQCSNAATVTSVTQTTAGAVERLAQGLLERLKQGSTKYVATSNGAGVSSGQLYYLIKDVVTPADTTPIDELKRSLMDHLFGAGVVSVEKVGDKEYFSAPMQDWQRVLGRLPQLRNG
jgi:hypothetical protein